MGLQEKLDAYKAQFVSSVPQEVVALMHRATEELRSSGILERVLTVGSQAPEFRLWNAHGEVVSSEDLLARGSLVVTFYRGVW